MLDLEYFDSYTFDKTSYSDGKYYYEYRFKGKIYPVTIDVNNDSIFCPEWAGFMNQVNSEEESAPHIASKSSFKNALFFTSSTKSISFAPS